jgi:CRP-like cAMP-binding protein
VVEPELSLKELSLFDGVDEARLRELEATLAKRSLDSNELVFSKDDRCDGLYVVARGGVTIRSEVAGQPVERVRELRPGELFGEIELLEGSRRHFSARAVEPTTVYQIPPDPLWEFLRSHPPVEARLRALAIHRRTSRLRLLLSPQTRRKEPRIWIDRPVLLTLEDGARSEARLENLSNSGACVSGAPPVWLPGVEVSFSLGAGKILDLLRVRGTVRWRDGDTVGLAFDGVGPAHRRRVDQTVRHLVDSRP